MAPRSRDRSSVRSRGFVTGRLSKGGPRAGDRAGRPTGQNIALSGLTVNPVTLDVSIDLVKGIQPRSSGHSSGEFEQSNRRDRVSRGGSDAKVAVVGAGRVGWPQRCSSPRAAMSRCSRPGARLADAPAASPSVMAAEELGFDRGPTFFLMPTCSRSSPPRAIDGLRLSRVSTRVPADHQPARLSNGINATRTLGVARGSG